MPAIQTTDEIRAILGRTEGQSITTLQVLGINSLKSMSPMPDALTDEFIESASVVDRVLTITTGRHQIVVDLQRTGKLVWLTTAAPYSIAAGALRPTVRLILASGQGVDFTEPAKTRRITVTISARP